MKKDIKYLIVPDVHGRDFWMNPVEETLKNRESQVVFLGDYLDPYPNEWESDTVSPLQAVEICRVQALDRFKQIIEIKKQYPGRVTLLLGNHDCGYAVGDDICDCRTDRRNRMEIEFLFRDNKELFQLAEECTLENRRYVFSHAGILKGWARMLWGSAVNDAEFRVVDRLNNAWLTDDYDVLGALGYYDAYRGWGGGQYGSPVWSDIRSWLKVTPEETFGFNICGHTQLDRPVVLDQIACLDCRRCFYLDEKGILRDYESGEEVRSDEKR